uniref:Uncharacterized protein n=1 Tax=Kalanchoe fedtschenkoi TaxID=63787 RepID=A0A7N0TH82_KALFE
MGRTALVPSNLACIFKLYSPPRLVAPKSRVKPLPERPIAAASAESKPPRSRMEASGSGGPGGSRRSNPVPLSEVVSDCVKRWFQDTLKEAKAGDSAMQVLVGQMYFNGYGVTKDVHKGRAWINKASKVRSSVWKVSEKRPGYNASDSDSEDTKVDAD